MGLWVSDEEREEYCSGMKEENHNMVILAFFLLFIGLFMIFIVTV